MDSIVTPEPRAPHIVHLVARCHDHSWIAEYRVSLPADDHTKHEALARVAVWRQADYFTPCVVEEGRARPVSDEEIRALLRPAEDLADARRLETTAPPPPVEPAPRQDDVVAADEVAPPLPPSEGADASAGDDDGSPPTAGREAVASLVDAEALNEALLLDMQTLRAVLAIEESDPGLFARFELRVQREKKLWPSVKKALDKLRQQSASTAVRVAAQLPGAPGADDSVVPADYRLSPNATLRRRGGGPGDTIAYAPIVIEEKLRDVFTGAEAFRLAWRDGGVWRRTTADRGVALNGPKLIALANDGFPVSSNTAAGVVDYLAAFEAANPRLPVARTTSQLGWQGRNGTDGFMLGEAHHAAPDVTPIAFRPQAPGDAQIASAFATSGTADGWRDAIVLLAPYPRVLFALYTAFVPPLLEPLGAPNFVLDLANPTSTGKTTAARIAASVWGQPNESLPSSVVQTWDATRVWIERGCGVLSGLPVVLDDTKRAKTPQLVADALYTIAHGRGRGRGNVVSVERVRSWRTVAISTGEAPATSFTQDGGTRMRCLELRGLPFERQDDETRRTVDRVNVAVAQHYGHAGDTFVRWLVDHRGEWPRLRERYDKARAVLAERNGRLANYVGAILVAAELVHQLFAFPWNPADVVDGVWPQLAAEAEDAPGADRALRHVLSWAQSNEARFDGRNDGDRSPAAGWAGRWKLSDWHYLSFYPSVLDDVLRDGGFEPEAILAQWKAADVLATNGDRGRYTRRVKLLGDAKWLVCIRRDAIERVNEQSA